MRALSIAKPGQGTVNEDSAKAERNVIAVSDGAGGGGIYADLWSKYLTDNLPENPITSFEELDNWIASIWEPFYNDCEERAKTGDGMVLRKFYEEGAFATLAAMWIENDCCRWVTYGDSVAFCYNPGSDELHYSFSSLAEFYRPPYLINCKDELKPEGVKTGTFRTERGSILFCASDALSHYILMMYQLSHCGKFADELQTAEKMNVKEATYIKSASSREIHFSDIIHKLMQCENERPFEQHLQTLLDNKLIALDDYSFAYTVVE